MKSILLALLLIVFSVQGLTVAIGGRVIAQPATWQNDAQEESKVLKAAQVQVEADIEEMSDFVAPGMVIGHPDTRMMRQPPHTPPMVSVDLPRAPPPPRG